MTSISITNVHLVLHGNFSVQQEQSGMNGSKIVTGIILFLHHPPHVDVGVSTKNTSICYSFVQHNVFHRTLVLKII